MELGDANSPPQSEDLDRADAHKNVQPDFNQKGCQRQVSQRALAAPWFILALNWGPKSMTTNKNKTMIAPAYTVTWAMAINGAPDQVNQAKSQKLIQDTARSNDLITKQHPQGGADDHHRHSAKN